MARKIFEYIRIYYWFLFLHYSFFLFARTLFFKFLFFRDNIDEMNFIDGFWIPRLQSLIFNFTGYSNLQLKFLQVKLKLRINIGELRFEQNWSNYYCYINIISRGKFRTLEWDKLYDIIVPRLTNEIKYNQNTLPFC